MRKFCLLLVALSVGSTPALAQSSNAADAEKKPATKRVCKRVADVNSLVAKKVCREVPVDETTQTSSNAPRQPATTGQGGSQ